MESRIEEIFVLEVPETVEKKVYKKSRRVLRQAEEFLTKAVEDRLNGRCGEC